MTWRDQIRPIVAKIIDEVGRDDMKRLRRELVQRRPTWVKTCSWQTKVWRDEVNVQLGLKAELQARKARKQDKQAGQRFFF